MNNYSYYYFSHPNQQSEESSKSNLESFIVKILESIIPVGNPDFENQLKQVDSWYIEYDEGANKINREVGMNKNNEVILILPFSDNLGYWSNSKLSIKDQNAIEMTPCTQADFEKRWELFELK